MRVLMAEDHSYADYYVDALRERYGHEVVQVRDPVEAQAALAGGGFDAAVVDIIFDAMPEEFAARSRDRHNPLSTDRLILSGLSIVYASNAAGTPVVVWTSGESNRKLHVIFAYEELRVRAFVSKRSSAGPANLDEALRSAVAGREYADVIIAASLPPARAVPMRQTILSDPASKRTIWRALAVGARSRKDIAVVTGLEEKTIGDLVLAMYEDVTALGVRLPTSSPHFDSRARLNELASFASFYSAFFLDDAVRVVFG
jgi:DNA-binding NarL/FixJ family response regulator